MIQCVTLLDYLYITYLNFFFECVNIKDLLEVVKENVIGEILPSINFSKRCKFL